MTVLLVFCIFYMIVETRRKDVAIMKSCGTARASAWQRIFYRVRGFYRDSRSGDWDIAWVYYNKKYQHNRGVDKGSVRA